MAINDNILTKILSSSHSLVMRYCRLVDRPVVEWRINNWVLSFNLSKVITVDTINDEVPQTKILFASGARVMGNSRLINRPVIERRVDNWVLLSDLHISLIFWLLGKFHSDRGRSIGDQILHLSTSNIGIHELEYAIFVRFLGKLDSDR